MQQQAQAFEWPVRQVASQRACIQGGFPFGCGVGKSSSTSSRHCCTRRVADARLPNGGGGAPHRHIPGMDFYVVLERPGYRVARRRRTARVGVQHRVTKDDAIK